MLWIEAFVEPQNVGHKLISAVPGLDLKGKDLTAREDGSLGKDTISVQLPFYLETTELSFLTPVSLESCFS